MVKIQEYNMACQHKKLDIYSIHLEEFPWNDR